MCQLVPSHLSASVPASEPPTAVHAEDDVQDTAERPAPAAGLGVGWMRQRVPFHRSASVPMPLPEASVRAPTAMQTEGDVHATPLRKPPGDEGAGTGWIRHFVPFHRSAKTPTGVPELLKEFPVAVQADDDVQDKPNRALPCAPGGLGVGWRRHREPSHRSASVPVKSPELSVRAPTAAQATADVQDTLARPPPARRLGVGWMRHFAPSHRSARVLALGVKALEAPTAMQDEADMHATPDRTPPPCLGLGVGVGWMRHRVPSHRSAKAPAFEFPPAVHADGDVHATPLRKPPPWAGLVAGWMRHRVPSHRSARGWDSPARVTLFPTAVHADGAVQETPDRELTAAPRGLGVGWMRHVLPFQCSARVTPTPEALT